MTSLMPAGLGGLVPRGPGRESRELSRVGNRLMAEVEIGARVTMLREQARAELANDMLTNVGALSSLEQMLAQTIPAGAGRYAAIVNAYTAGATATLLRFK